MFLRLVIRRLEVSLSSASSEVLPSACAAPFRTGLTCRRADPPVSLAVGLVWPRPWVPSKWPVWEMDSTPTLVDLRRAKWEENRRGSKNCRNDVSLFRGAVSHGSCSRRCVWKEGGEKGDGKWWASVLLRDPSSRDTVDPDTVSHLYHPCVVQLHTSVVMSDAGLEGRTLGPLPG